MEADLLHDAARRAADYVAGVDARPVAPSPEAVEALATLHEPMPDRGVDAAATLALLDEVGGPATVATTGDGYYGFVVGGVQPVALAASWLTAAWDQNAALPVMSPIAATLGEVVSGWLVDLLGLPAETAAVFVTGATMANASGLTAARDALAARRGWDVQADGLAGAPPLSVVVGERAHSTLSKSLGLVGLGRSRVHVVPADGQGRMRIERLPRLEGPILVCAQAGEVNTGAFDPFGPLADWVAERDGWLHVDGAFGLWAAASPSCAALVAGLDRADSWATDGHKWLNVTYDSGIAFVRRAEDLRRSFAAVADYLPPDAGFEAMHHTPQSSQRARVVEVWAVLRTLGREGVAALVDRCVDTARVIAEAARAEGLEVLNEVVLNQVLLRLVDGPTTTRLIEAVQRDGRIWCGPTVWEGEPAMRISVSSWKSDPARGRVAAGVIGECARDVLSRAAPGR